MARAALVLLLAAGCAARSSAPALRSADVIAGGARFRVAWSPGDERSAREVIRAVEAAAPRVRRWGPLARPVAITVHPDHESLEAAAHRYGYSWLRAWARYDTIDIQSPRTWSLFAVPPAKVEELVAHELTHCAMYQRAGTALDWMYKEIPRWFSEGLATITAGQGYRFPGAEQLREVYVRRPPGAAFGEGTDPAAPHGDLLDESDPIDERERSEIAYGAAHHAAALLLRQYGEERVRDVLGRMGAGARFHEAFRAAIGVTDGEFAADFRHWLVWEGWRR